MVLVATWRAASRWAKVLFVAPRSPAPRREGSAPPRPRMGNHPHVAWAQAWRRILKPRMQGSRDGVWWMGRRGGFARRGRGRRGAGESSRYEDPAPTVGVGGEDIKTSAPNKTTRHAASLSAFTPPTHGAPTVFIMAREGWALAGGRGNLRENREDPAPTGGHLRGCHCDPHCDPNAAHCRHHAHTMPRMETCGFYNDAALRSSRYGIS